MIDLSDINDAIVKLAIRCNAYSKTDDHILIDDRLRMFYDFEFSKNKKIISLNSFIPFTGTVTEQKDVFEFDDSRYANYEHSWQIMSVIKQKLDFKKNVNVITMTTDNGKYHDYVASGESIYNTLSK